MTEIIDLGVAHGRQYADEYWQIWPADYNDAVEWCKAADAGTLHEFGLPDEADDVMGFHPDLNTAGWSWSELADYQGAWQQGLYARFTELCRDVIAREVA